MILDRFRLDGKVALVTGASRGIGRGVAVAFAEAGADVALAARTAADLEATASQIRALGRRALVIPTDVTDRTQIAAMVRRTVAELGGLDVLVPAAGIPNRKPTVELTDEDYARVFDTNIKGVLFTCAEAGQHFLAQGSGSIVNICSLTTTFGFPGRALYGSTKGAVGQLTKSLAVEWGPRGVRVNAVAPGWIVTELSRGALSDPELRGTIVGRTPLGRLGEVDDVVGTVVFLASDAAAFVSGVIVGVDGGYVAKGL
jgi:2-deoxy-D-gluconate 3-dehydrogenase